MFFRCVQICKSIETTIGFEGLTGCVRDQKRYQQTIKNDTNIHPKIDEIQGKFHDRTRCPKMMPKEPKWRPTVILKSNVNCKGGSSERG